MNYVAPTPTADLADTAALVGLTLGRRERHLGHMRCIADITVGQVVEPVSDLAVADRVAFVLACRTNGAFAVIAGDTTYLVVALTEVLNTDELDSFTAYKGTPTLVSVATRNGVRPLIDLSE